MPEEKIKLSVVIPAFNEAERSLKTNVLEDISRYLSKAGYSYEVILIDDGSADNTAQVIKEQIKDKKTFRLIENPHGGKAIAVMTGLIAAKGDIALFMDMDESTPLKEVEKFFPKFAEGYDMVIGSRDGREGAPVVRKLASVVFATLRNIILGLPFSDTQCGFKACNKSSRDTIFPPMLKEWSKQSVQGYSVSAGFDIEFLYRAKKFGFKITDVPVEWHYVNNQGYQLIKNAISALGDMFRIKVNDLQGHYR